MKKSIILKSAATFLLAVLVLFASVAQGSITAKAEEGNAAEQASFFLTDTAGSSVAFAKEDTEELQAHTASFTHQEGEGVFVQTGVFYSVLEILEKTFPQNDVIFDLEISSYDDPEKKIKYTIEEIKDLFIYESEENIYSSAINGSSKDKWVSKVKEIKMVPSAEAAEAVSEETKSTAEEAAAEEPTAQEKTQEEQTAQEPASEELENQEPRSSSQATTEEETSKMAASGKKVTVQASSSKTSTQSAKKMTTQASSAKTYKWNQKVNSRYNGLAQEKSGTWYYLKNGKPNFKFSDLVYYNENWFYVKKGVIDWKYSNLVYYNGNWFYVRNGKIDWNYSTLSQVNKKGAWYKVTNGMIDWNFNGLTKYKNTWFFIRNGVLDRKYSNLTYFKNAWYYIYKGKVDKKYSGLVFYNNTWFYVHKGKINWNLSTLGRVNNSGKWYQVTNGVLNWNYNGLFKYKGTWYYIQNGVWQNGYNNLLFTNNKWYFVSKGKITYKYTNLVFYNNNWFYVKKSMIDWNARTLAQVDNKGAWFYVNGGVIDWSYNGSFKFNGTTYKVENGVATPVKKQSYYDGIDVSDHNGKLDWASIKKGGTKFAIIRIGWGSDIASQDDSTALYNMQQCEKYGIPYGVYIYSYALSNKDVDSEVKHTVRMIKGRNPQLGIWFDMEDADSYKQRNGMNPYTNGKTLTNFCLRFMKGMKARGYYHVGVYANPDYFWNVLDYKAIAKEGMVWLAHWEVSKPASQFPHVMWQYGGGSIKGASGFFDLDRIYSNSPLANYLY